MTLFRKGTFFFQCINIISFSFLFVSVGYAGPLEYYVLQQRENNKPLIAAKSIMTAYFQQWIAHDAHDKGTFPQRYYIDETYGLAPDSPVFFYICGEATCTPRALNGAIREYAKKFHAKLVALEHRYYGESIPKPTFSTKDLQDLTTDAALKDLANFQQEIIAKNQWRGPWVAFGGSYPGSLSAYYRLKYPELVVGALASSAPVMAKEDFFEYDSHVTDVAGAECASKMREAVRDVESALVDKARFEHIKTLFKASEIIDNLDFIYVIADVGATAVQYGMRDAFCNQFYDENYTPLENYAIAALAIYKAFGTNAVEMSMQSALSENPADYKGLGLRPWLYQSCTEYGYWQNANQDETKSTRSLLINAAYHQNVCHRLFGIDEPAHTDLINASLYFPLLDESVTRIYFTNGENDPWSLLSMAEKNGNATNKNLNYNLIKGAAHCDDLRSPTTKDSESLKAARHTTELLIKQWLDG
jgi:pimeloyl-ACP methyl ester carboxylesterase